MAEFFNLRRARKAKTREEAGKNAVANRLKFGTSKTSRTAKAAEKARADQRVDSHKIEKD